MAGKERPGARKEASGERGVTRIGVLGGSFDPPHVGHLVLAQDAAEFLSLDAVLFIPAAQAPLKPASPVAPADLRLEMLRAAVAPHAARGWAVSDWEMRRGGESFSIHTARHLLATHPGAEIHWLIGADRLADLARWNCATELFQLVHFAAAQRTNADGGGAPAKPPSAPAGARVVFLPPRRLDISSTEIRARLGAGLPVDLFLPPGVNEIIQRRMPYQPPPGGFP